jgi:ABC-type branched-subunit amino acid transport system substrate-binding protein
MATFRHRLSAAVAAALATATFAVASSATATRVESPPGIDDESIKLGTTLPITGTAALAGQGLLAGIELAV